MTVTKLLVDNVDNAADNPLVAAIPAVRDPGWVAATGCSARPRVGG